MSEAMANYDLHRLLTAGQESGLYLRYCLLMIRAALAAMVVASTHPAPMRR